MDWPTFTVEMVKALAWPAATITALAMLRRPITGLIPLVQKLKYKDLELEFGQQVKEARAEAAAELPGAAFPALPPGQESALRELAKVSPRSAVTESWREVEAAAQDASRANNVSLSYRAGSSPSYVIRELEKAGVVDSGQVALFHDLRGLRNQAVHAPEFALSSDAALEYAELAHRLAEYLRKAGRKGLASGDDV